VVREGYSVHVAVKAGVAQGESGSEFNPHKSVPVPKNAQT